MADNHILSADEGAGLGLVGDRTHGRLDLNLLRDGICRDGVSLSTAEQGRRLLSRLALLLDGLGWLPPDTARTVVEVVGDTSIEMARSDGVDANTEPPEWLRRRVDQAAAYAGAAAATRRLLAVAEQHGTEAIWDSAKHRRPPQ